MIRHVVMWTFPEHAAGRPRAENLALAKELLDGLPAAIAGVVRFETGIDELVGPASAHLVLVSDLADWDALAAYRDHPAHQEAVAFLGQVAEGRWVVDYEHAG